MKSPWMTLAALVAFVAAAAEATVMEPQAEAARALRYFPCFRPGCYASISQLIPQMTPDSTSQPHFLDWQQQLHLEEKPTEEASLSILQHLKVASTWDRRAKRNTRKAPPARRRGKQREGARPACRGCYSGLTIVAPPAQGGKNESLKWSHSESGEDSSGGY